jgi:hypothetical protein
MQLDIGLKELNKIIQNALLGEDGKKDIYKTGN